MCPLLEAHICDYDGVQLRNELPYKRSYLIHMLLMAILWSEFVMKTQFIILFITILLYFVTKVH